MDHSTETKIYTTALFRDAWAALGGGPREVGLRGERILPAAPFGVSALSAAAFAAAGSAVAELLEAAGASPPPVTVDAELASAWMRTPTHPVGWERGTPWHAVSTDYPTADGRWVRLQANYPRLREATARVLGVPVDPDAFAAVFRAHDADEIEQAIVAGGGAAAATRSLAEWDAHPHGRTLREEPLVDVIAGDAADDTWTPLPGRPLSGIRVLDITRVLAGPMATRFLAGYGAEVLRIDPPGYAEPDGESGGDLTLGKRCAHLPLDTDEGRDRFLALLAEADVLVHGLRPGALDGLGLGEAARRAARPGLVEVTLNAYGWTGPWAGRRGFDTLVQTSAGMSTELMRRAGGARPELLPAQVLDFATGYLMAAAALRGLTRRMTEGRGSSWRLALARTARLMLAHGAPPEGPALAVPVAPDPHGRIFTSPYGPVRRLAFPLEVGGSPLFWERPGDPYGSATPRWASRAPIGRAPC